MPKKRARPAISTAEKEAEVLVEEEVVSSAKRRRASKGKRKRSSRAEAAEDTDTGRQTPQRASGARARGSGAGAGGGGDGDGRKTAAPKRSSKSDDPFNAAASAAHLGLDIVDDSDGATGGAAATAGSASDATPVAARGAPAAEPSWLELTPERMVRLGQGSDSRAVRVLLRLADAEFVVLEGFYRVRVLHGSVSVGAYTLSPADGWQPVYAAATSAHYIQTVKGAVQRGSRADSVASSAQHAVEVSSASGLWRLAPSQTGAVIALESGSADGLAFSAAFDLANESNGQVTVLPAVEGRSLRELGLGLELCRLVPPPASPSSPSQQMDSSSGKPSSMKPAIAPREWRHVSVARHSTICSWCPISDVGLCGPVCYRLSLSHSLSLSLSLSAGCQQRQSDAQAGLGESQLKRGCSHCHRRRRKERWKVNALPAAPELATGSAC